MNINDTISHRNSRKRAAVNAAIRARSAAAFFKAWSELKVESGDLRAKKEGLLHAEKGDTAKALAPAPEGIASCRNGSGVDAPSE